MNSLLKPRKADIQQSVCYLSTWQVMSAEQTV